ncbi:MAG: F0F1 ATP synthase subunit epsilon [Candidatus Edwardsbacteria bacterium]|nr:F0F1 ATP synthase subunit epsilon [Candidatus Edwardsbacteria bacterium]
MPLVFQFEITTPERTVFKEPARQVTLPTSMGEITILPHHLPLVSLLVPGVLHIIRENGAELVLAVSGGFIEVQGDKVTVLADTAERAEEIDEARAEEAKKHAEEAMKERKDTEAFTSANANLERNLARVRAVKRWRGRRHSADHTPKPLGE